MNRYLTPGINTLARLTEQRLKIDKTLLQWRLVSAAVSRLCRRLNVKLVKFKLCRRKKSLSSMSDHRLRFDIEIVTDTSVRVIIEMSNKCLPSHESLLYRSWADFAPSKLGQRNCLVPS